MKVTRRERLVSARKRLEAICFQVGRSWGFTVVAVFSGHTRRRVGLGLRKAMTYKWLFRLGMVWLFLWGGFGLRGQWPATLRQRFSREFKLYGFEEGLSHRNMYDLVQDSTGFLWLGSLRGLNRFDGYGFTVFDSKSEAHPLPEDFVERLSSAPDGLWYAHGQRFFKWSSAGQGWRYFQLVRRMGRPMPTEVFSLAKAEADSLSGLHIDGLLAVPDSSLWMVVYDERLEKNHLLHVDVQGSLLSYFPLSGNYTRRAMYWDGEHLLVAGFENEVWFFDAAGRWQDKISLSYRGRDKARARILSIRSDGQGGLLVLLQDGRLLHRLRGSHRFELHPISDLLSAGYAYEDLVADEEGNLWLASQNRLAFWDAETGYLEDLSVEVQKLTRFPPHIRRLLRDASGVLWLATEFGAIKIVQHKEYFQTYLKDGNSWCQSGFCSMRGMAEDDAGNIYFSYYNGLHVLQKGAERAEPLFPNRHWRLAPFGLAWYRGALFTGAGLRIEPSSGKIDSLPLSLSETEGIPYVDGADRLWLASGGRLFLWNETTHRFDFFPLEGFAGDSLPSKITALAEGHRSGTLWLGTRSDGVYGLEVERHLAKAQTPTRGKYVLAVHEGNNGVLWLGTSEGLVQLDLLNGQMHTFAERQGLSNTFINGLLAEGDSALWVSTDKGLARFSMQSGTFHLFFKEDGLAANEFNRISFLKSRSGRFFFGGLNGVTAFYPGPEMEQLRQNLSGKLLLTEFSKYDGRFDSIINLPLYSSSGTPITLTHRDRFFTLSYALANYANPGNHLFSYMLEGYDARWSDPARTHQVRYNNLPAGHYVFKLRAALGEGQWSPDILAVPIIVKQAFYKTTWFLTLCFLFFAFLIYSIMRYRLHLLRKREQFLEEQVQKRTAELQEEKQKSDRLLLNILPPDTAEELKEKGYARARRHDGVSVLFLDFQNFTKVAERYTPEKLVAEIDWYFQAFDRLVEKYGLEKIKTIGDAYMCAAGFDEKEAKKAALQTVAAALEMQAFVERAFEERGNRWRARIGIHTGPVVAGVVGLKKFAYDIWGDTVNIAARMEACGEVGLVNISEATRSLVDEVYLCRARGEIKAKNKGRISMYFVTPR